MSCFLALNPRRHAACLATALTLGAALPARAHGGLSEASALSLMMPVAVSVVAPVTILSAGATLTVVGVEASARGTVWALERASDGARASVEFAGVGVQASAVAVGTAVVATTIAGGVVLSAAGRAIAFVPNEVGAALLHHERLTR